MKALSIRQPWAWLIVNGYKDIENRKWKTKHRGTFLVHASLTLDYQAIKDYSHLLPPLGMLHTGAIIGQATIIDCVEQSDSRWFTGPFGFVLKDQIELIEPVPYKGKLNFFNVEI